MTMTSDTLRTEQPTQGTRRPIGVVLNPNSRKNKKRGGQRAQHLEQLLGAEGRIIATQTLDELRPALRQLLREGVDYLVSDGGDGALHWLLHETRALLEEPEFRGRDLPPVIPTYGGTIDFVARKAQMSGSSDDIVRELARMLRRGETPELVWLDSLRLTGVQVVDGEERAFDRIGFALAAGGVGNRFFDQYYAEPDPSPMSIVTIVSRTTISFFGNALRLPLPPEARGYARQFFEPSRARVTIGGKVVPSEEHGAIHAGAFDVSLGGVFKVFPFATQPGTFHFQAGPLDPLEAILAIPDLVRGTKIRARGLVEESGQHMLVEALGDELLAPVCDGEQFTGLKNIEVQPGPVIAVGRVCA